jgi:hypothetical protein
VAVLKRALLGTLVFCAACNTLDVSRPIAILATDLPPGTEEALSNAAECWNLQFGTQLTMGGPHDPGQTIDVTPSDFVCAEEAWGRTDPWLPVHISICDQLPEFAWWLPFRIVIHELGHALNIRPHSPDPKAIMSSSDNFPSRFAEDDCARFYEANPDMPRQLACGAVSISWSTLGCSVPSEE